MTDGDRIDCLVVGAGPAGLTAALYLRRFRRDVRIVDDGASRALRIGTSHNVAGFPAGITGRMLLHRMRRHLSAYGGQVIGGTVRSLERLQDGTFGARFGRRSFIARTVILCTGVRDRPVPLTGVGDVESAGLLRACPVCDAYEYTGTRIGVVAEGPHGIREAAFLRHFSSRVRVLLIGGHGSGNLEREADAQGVAVLAGQPQRLAVGENRELVAAMDNGATHRFDVLYGALGVDPRTELVVALHVRLDESRQVQADTHGRTDVLNLLAAGDVVSGLHQMSVAVGQAAMAATAVHNAL